MAGSDGLALTLGAALVVAGCDSSGAVCHTVDGLDFAAPPVREFPSTPPAIDETLAVIADTQRTSWQECFIGREVNDREQEILLDTLHSRQPGAVVIAGDMVFDGSSATHWRFFDHLMRDFGDDGTPLLTVPGNHEYWADNDDAREHMHARFPRLVGDSWFADSWGAVALVMLDSNRDQIGDGDWARQEAWFRSIMDALDADPNHRGILFFMHHPPITNSTVVHPDEDVQSTFVDRFCASPKTLAFITGHAHGYEHFLRGPAEGCGNSTRHFIISGGGGGPRPDDLHSEFPDTFAGPAPRPFNYMLVHQDGTGVDFVVEGLHKGKSDVVTLEAFRIDF